MTESRLAVGSSARTRFGWLTMARATATRCCWPPDNCAGRRSSMPSSPTSFRMAIDLRASLRGRHALDLHDEFDVFARGQHRDQVVGLEHEADVVQAQIGQCALAQQVDALAVDG